MNRIVAEIGSVHDGSFGNACKLIEAAAECGADTVKFQTHIADVESLTDAPNPAYFDGESRLDYFRRTTFSVDEWTQLKAVSEDVGVSFLSSPFSIEAVDLLEKAGVESYKIPSGEVTNIPLLERIGETGKPTLLSSGMSSWEELDRAVETLRGRCDLAIMQCTSEYPCPAERAGLNVISEIESRYGLAVGFSDHTTGVAAAFAAAALGATVIEKHFTFSRLMYGSDARNSMEPGEFRTFCSGLRDIWTMLANPVDKDDLAPYAEMKRVFEKSVVTARPLDAGEVIKWPMLAFKKPGDGISAARFREVIGRKTTRALEADHKLQWSDLI